MKKYFLAIVGIIVVSSTVALNAFASDDKCADAVSFCHNKSKQNTVTCQSCYDKVVTKNCTSTQLAQSSNAKSAVCSWN